MHRARRGGPLGLADRAAETAAWTKAIPALIAAFLLILLAAGIGATFLAGQSSARCRPAAVTTWTVRGVPAKLIPIYERGAARYRLGAEGPAILAAINFVETDFGRNMGTSSAGAVGWMQFLPSSWRAYGVDADGDGRRDPYDPADAIYAAANLLHASGAPGDWRGAIFAYNHAQWYVDEVLRYARRHRGATTITGAPAPAADSCQSGDAAGGYVNPLGENSRWLAERTDMGVDYAPYGASAPVLAIGAAKVIGSDDHSGWPGAHFLWYRLLDGDHAGDIVYVAETLTDMVAAGTTVTAGQRVATALHGGTGIETGWALADGETRAAPCYREGMVTNSGREFARFLQGLGARVAMDPGPGPGRPTGPDC
jgi:hypothetical protein